VTMEDVIRYQEPDNIIYTLSLATDSHVIYLEAADTLSCSHNGKEHKEKVKWCDVEKGLKLYC
jgi:hypothetical protein